jgi:hypothetical protein
MCCAQPQSQSYGVAVQALASNKDKSVAFKQFVEWNEKCEGATLDSMLSLPNVALMRYLNALEEIKTAVPNVRVCCVYHILLSAI